MPKRDANQESADAVKRVTKATPTLGEDLLGSDELKRQLHAAKVEEQKRREKSASKTRRN